MGFAWKYMQRLEQMDLLPKSGQRVLDVGSSNLYFATTPEVKAFLQRHGYHRGDLDELSERIAHGSRYDPIHGGANETFLGQLLEAIAVSYDSIDVAHGFKTTIVDLNIDGLPRKFRNAFQLVLHFGTTEHILNQYNCFRVMHDAIAIGGTIWHQVPGLGYLNHGYFTYTGRLFFDLAVANEYELVDVWFDPPGGAEKLMDGWDQYAVTFPAFDKQAKHVELGAGRDSGVPETNLNAIYRKANGKPFRHPLETTTCVGPLDARIASLHGIYHSRRTAAFDLRQKMLAAIKSWL